MMKNNFIRKIANLITEDPDIIEEGRWSKCPKCGNEDAYLSFNNQWECPDANCELHSEKQEKSLMPTVSLPKWIDYKGDSFVLEPLDQTLPIFKEIPELVRILHDYGATKESDWFNYDEDDRVSPPDYDFKPGLWTTREINQNLIPQIQKEYNKDPTFDTYDVAEAIGTSEFIPEDWFL